MQTTTAVSEAEELIRSVKRHRAGLASAVERLMGRSKSLTATERRTLLKTLQSSRAAIEKLELAVGDGGLTLTS